MIKRDDDPLIRWMAFLIALLVISGIFAYAYWRTSQEYKKLNEDTVRIINSRNEQLEQLQKEIELKNQEIEKKNTEIKKLSLQRQQRKNVIATATTTPFNGVLEGKVSHYSRNGCLGCSPNLTMANGEPLDDNRLTIAVPPGTIPMNSHVKVTNTTTGLSVLAMVTDTGGFAKLGRIADLTPAVANAIGTVTDKSHVVIEVVQ